MISSKLINNVVLYINLIQNISCISISLPKFNNLDMALSGADAMTLNILANIHQKIVDPS
jgi:hypothetical protein